MLIVVRLESSNLYYSLGVAKYQMVEETINKFGSSGQNLLD